MVLMNRRQTQISTLHSPLSTLHSKQNTSYLLPPTSYLLPPTSSLLYPGSRLTGTFCFLAYRMVLRVPPDWPLYTAITRALWLTIHSFRF